MKKKTLDDLEPWHGIWECHRSGPNVSEKHAFIKPSSHDLRWKSEIAWVKVYKKIPEYANLKGQIFIEVVKKSPKPFVLIYIEGLLFFPQQ